MTSTVRILVYPMLCFGSALVSSCEEREMQVDSNNSNWIHHSFAPDSTNHIVVYDDQSDARIEVSVVGTAGVNELLLHKAEGGELRYSFYPNGLLSTVSLYREGGRDGWTYYYSLKGEFLGRTLFENDSIVQDLPFEQGKHEQLN
ncbi:MAG: hypothetical protein IPJ76_15420 [Flavobacteriales bacterium]|nr:MAG: hypothetical protein IPJ76_15420 [Flavobacteriales bacterium]